MLQVAETHLQELYTNISLLNIISFMPDAGLTVQGIMALEGMIRPSLHSIFHFWHGKSENIHHAIGYCTSTIDAALPVLPVKVGRHTVVLVCSSFAILQDDMYFVSIKHISEAKK